MFGNLVSIDYQLICIIICLNDYDIVHVCVKVALLSLFIVFGQIVNRKNRNKDSER